MYYFCWMVWVFIMQEIFVNIRDLMRVELRRPINLLIIIIISNLAEIVDDVHYEASIFPATLAHAHSRFCQRTTDTSVKQNCKSPVAKISFNRPTFSSQDHFSLVHWALVVALALGFFLIAGIHSAVNDHFGRLMKRKRHHHSRQVIISTAAACRGKNGAKNQYAED